MYIMTDPITLSLISGLVGAVVGGLFTLLATVHSIRRSAEEALALDAKKRKRDQSNQFKTAKKALLTETKENLESINHWKRYRGKFRFTAEAWTLYKHHIVDLSHSLQDLLLKAYTEMERYNTLISYDIHVDYGTGYYDSEIERRIGVVAEDLRALVKSLESELDIEPHIDLPSGVADYQK